MKNKKLFWLIISSVIVVILIVVALLVYLPHNEKLSSESIEFSFSNENFKSNYKEGSTCDSYTLTISTTKNKFENPYLSSSVNVQMSTSAIYNDYSIMVNFKIVSGTSFWFELETENYQTIKKEYSATEYIQSSRIQLQINNGTNTQNFVNNVNNLLFLVEDEYKLQAQQDGFFTELNLLPYEKETNNHLFTMSVAPTGKLNLNGNKLTGKDVGNSDVTVWANDGSGAHKDFRFTVDYVKANDFSFSEELIQLDIASTEISTFQGNVLPIYSHDKTFQIESDNAEIFTVNNSNKQLYPKNTGNANLIVRFGEKSKTIPVAVVNTATQKISIRLNEYLPTSCFNLQNQSGNVYNLTIDKSNLDFMSMVLENIFALSIYVGVDNTNISKDNFNEDIVEGEEYIKKQLSPDVSGKEFVYNIYIDKDYDNIQIKFSTIIDNKNIFAILNIFC